MIRILTYGLLFVAALVLGNLFYVASGLYNKDIRTCQAEAVYTVDSLNKTGKAIYFGESSNFTTAPGDSSTASISMLVNQFYGSDIMGTIEKSASHAGIYKKLVERLEHPKAVIITMNLRSFGINWIESDLETNLSRASLFYSDYPPVLQKLLVSFKAYDNKDAAERQRIIKHHYKHDPLPSGICSYAHVREWDAYMFDKGHVDADGKRDKDRCELACHYIKNYAFMLDEKNPRVRDFDAIAEYCAAHHIKLLFHLLPENYMKAEELCGKELTAIMKRNADFLQERYGKRVIFLNNWKALPDSCFIDKAWPTEHYIYNGRRQVAASIAQALFSNGIR